MERLLFLTSTVYPSGVKFAGTQEQRRLEYIKAIKFYLAETDYKILIVDNSAYDYNRDFQKNERLECLAYKAKDHSDFGKGYGELCLMKYGFEHSIFIKEADQIVKITGRHIIKNINQILVPCSQKDAAYIDIDIHLSFAMTYFFVSPKSFYTSYLFPNINKLNDSKHCYLEHIVARCLVKWLDEHHEFHEFKYPIYIIGHQGTSNTTYKTPGLIRYIKIGMKYLLIEIVNKFNKTLSKSNG